MAGRVNLRALENGLSLDGPRERAATVLKALGWDSAEAEVEWMPISDELGRFTLGGFPTSASMVAAKPSERPWEPAWHAGFRWCITADPGALRWFDLKNRLAWTGSNGTLNERVLSGLTPAGFAACGQLAPRETTPVDVLGLRAENPTRLVTERIESWWDLYCARYAQQGQSLEDAQRLKDTFTRFVAGVLLLRTIEDLDRVAWLRPDSLRRATDAQGTWDRLQGFVRDASNRLNSRVLRGIRQVAFDIARTIIQESYAIGVNFGALEVDPVGAFYEDILGVDYEHEQKAQRSLFGNDLKTSADWTARRAKGVYYTPRIYADTLARMLVRPLVRTAESVEELPIVTDIAAGSGELLCAALREILIEPAWRKPEVAWQVLDKKMQAIDASPLASQLCALNLLRTAIRCVPALLEGDRPLPSLTDNLRRGDALQKATLEALPAPDVVLINPPFHAPNRWTRPDRATAIPEIFEVEAYPHQAIAFFAAAVRVARPGAGLGVVMPSTLFTGRLSARWREWLSRHVRLDLVVANYGTPFRDVHSYAGLVVGKKQASERQWRPRTRVVHIGGLIRAEEWDTAVLLAEPGQNNDIVKSRIVPPVVASSEWLGGKRRRAASSRGKAALQEVMGDRFHQGVVLAPKPWRGKLFTFCGLPDGKVKHDLTGKIANRSSRLRPFVNAKTISPKVPLWCEPVVEDRWVFVPPGGGSQWFDINSLRKTDPNSYELGRIILEAISSGQAAEGMAREFIARGKQGEIRFRTHNSYQENELPLVYASRTSVTAASRGQGRAWYAWVNLRGNVIPAAGLQLRATRPEFAASVVVWMSQDDLILPLLDSGAPRLDGSVEFNLADVAAWPIPDLREDRLQQRLDELYAAFLAYREQAEGMTPAEALMLQEYREVQELAQALWDEA